VGVGRCSVLRQAERDFRYSVKAVVLKEEKLARHGLADEALKQRAVDLEVARLMRHIAWLHPALAQEVLRVCKRKVDERVSKGSSTVARRVADVVS
jgi:hypothetical protein